MLKINVKKLLLCSLCALCLTFIFSILVFAEPNSGYVESGEANDIVPSQDRDARRMDSQGENEDTAANENTGGRNVRRGGMGAPPDENIQPPNMSNNNGDTSQPSDNGQGGNTGDRNMPPQPPNGDTPPFFPNENMDDGTKTTDMANVVNGPKNSTDILGFVKEYFTPIISVALFALAFIFVIFYKRKRY